MPADQRDPVAHSQRFRRVSDRYPRRVAEAYDGDTVRAARDSDEQVAAAVAEWERAHGIEPRHWHDIGTDEGRDPDRLPSRRIPDAYGQG